MSNYVECQSGDKGLLNTGTKEECFLGVTTKYAVSPDVNFAFDSLEDIKDLDQWNTAIAEKEIYPLSDAEEYAIADTEDTFFEGLRKQYKTANGKKIRTFRTIVGLCTYRALRRFNDKTVRVFEFTEDAGIKAVRDADGKFKGQKVTIQVGKLQDTISGTPQSAIVTVTYTDENEYIENGANLRLEGWGDQDLFGIFDVNLVQVSASATSIKFKVLAGCGTGHEPVTSLIAANVVVKDGAGATQTVSFVTPDNDGVYEVTGTDFANGFTVELDGVVTVGGTSYEAVEPLVVSGIS